MSSAYRGSALSKERTGEWAPSPLAGEGWGEGYHTGGLNMSFDDKPTRPSIISPAATPLPTLSRKGRGSLTIVLTSLASLEG
ncbi:hypothetical protein XH93_40235 [Bradyrhizobium sp. CCBAU 51753]|nr:hypothetical protein XH93_40235 [Bradyrhizobium sp. CCBAU 51753]